MIGEAFLPEAKRIVEQLRTQGSRIVQFVDLQCGPNNTLVLIAEALEIQSRGLYRQ